MRVEASLILVEGTPSKFSFFVCGYFWVDCCEKINVFVLDLHVFFYLLEVNFL